MASGSPDRDRRELDDLFALVIFIEPCTEVPLTCSQVEK